jgi:centromeric protein E
LSKVIVALVERGKSNNPNSYINFRDCKLTRILESSLNGNSKTAIICTVSGLPSNLSETHNSIKFAANAGQIKLSSKANFV